MKNRAIPQSDNWATPPDFYRSLDEEFHFDFDPCPLSLQSITPENDGLLISWGKRNFINPPYSRKLREAFVKRAILKASEGAICVCLLPVSTSTSLYHDHIQPNADEIRFVRGRIAFRGVNTKGEYTETAKGMHDSMVVIFRPKETSDA